MNTTKLSIRFWMAMALACVLAVAISNGVMAQSQAPAKLNGQIFDQQGQPFGGIMIVLKSTTSNQEIEVTADAQGKFSKDGIPPGEYAISLKVQDKGTLKTLFTATTTLASGQNPDLNLNFKDQAAGASDDKQPTDAKAKFAAMKAHFDAGTAALDQAKQVRAQYDKLPTDQQKAMLPQLDQAAAPAITELQAALDNTADTDPNRSIVLARLGEAYSTDNKFTDAADAYQKAVALKPDPGYYNNLGNSLARTGKVDDALTAYQKAIELDPANTAQYWRNFAIGLYNTGRIKDSVDPLQKATAADPKNAQAWYLLGAALVNTMDFKQDGDKMIPVMKPGTQEAYQHAIDLDPNGPWGAQAKEGLAELQAMGVGIDTKIGTKAAPSKAPAKKN